MRRILSCLAILLCLTLPASGQLFFPLVSAPVGTLVCSAAWKGNSSDPSPSENCAGSSLFVMVVTAYDLPLNAPAPSDTKSNAWTLALTINTTGGNITQWVYYAANPASANGQTFSTNISGSVPTAYVMGFSGIATASPLDQSSSFDAGHGSSATTIQPGSITPSGNNYLVVTTEGDFTGTGTGATKTVNGGYVIPTGLSTAGVSGSWQGAGAAYLVQGAATATNPTWTLSSATNQFDLLAGILSFKPSSASSCPNSLVFSNACNSQYLAIGGLM